MKRIFIVLFLFLIVLGGCSQKSNETEKSSQKDQEFPDKTIKLIVPFNSGGAIDTTARVLADAVNAKLNKGHIVIVNKPGGGGSIGATDVMNAEADGYTLGFVPLSTIVIQPHLGSTLYSHDSFQSIARIGTNPQVLVVKSDSPWKTFEDWLNYVKNNPGKFIYGTGGTGSLQHITMEAISSSLDTKMKMIPFDSGAQIMSNLLGGHIDGAIVYPSDTTSNKENVRILAYAGDANEVLTNITSFNEQGIDLGFEGHISYGFIAPKGLPEDVLSELQTLIRTALEDEKVLELLDTLGINSSYADSEEYQEELSSSFNSIGEIMEELQLTK